MKGKDEIKELFQKELGNYQAKVNPNLWNGVQAGLGSSAVASSAIGLTTKIIIGVVTAVGITVGTIVLVNNNKKPSTKKQEIVQNVPPQKKKQKDSDASKTKNTESVSIQTAVNKNKHQKSKHEDNSNIKSGVETPVNTKETKPAHDLQPMESDHTLTPEPSVKKASPSKGNNKENLSTNVPSDNSKKANKKVDLTNVWAGIAKQKNQFVHFSTKGIPKNASVEWNFGDGNYDYTAQPDHFYASSGDYTAQLTIKSEEGTITKEIPVHVEVKGKIGKLPNVFTPNGDGENDVLFIHSENIASFQITIMDLNQKVIYSSSNPNFRWKGINKDGRPVKTGKYIYSIVAKDNSGNVINKFQRLTIRR